MSSRDSRRFSSSPRLRPSSLPPRPLDRRDPQGLPVTNKPPLATLLLSPIIPSTFFFSYHPSTPINHLPVVTAPPAAADIRKVFLEKVAAVTATAITVPLPSMAVLAPTRLAPLAP
ncbi:hypothetical protein DL770_010112 [Monosporascus sp. CRB-9-2]|nr:hypothetical protein DL770_010112 [Monosporascus sp. CRB-9-2]